MGCRGLMKRRCDNLGCDNFFTADLSHFAGTQAVRQVEVVTVLVTEVVTTEKPDFMGATGYM